MNSYFQTMNNKVFTGLFILLFSVSGFILGPGNKPVDTKQKIELGRLLFNEKILSFDSSVSCASCHKPEFAFADTVPFSTGINGKLTTRNTPSVLNMKNRPYYFWDGRAPSLSRQALIPIVNPDEMGMTVKEVVRRLNASPKYKALFFKVFRQKPNAINLATALAAFEESLETVDSPFDDWSNDIDSLTASEERGRELFIGKAACFDCHSMQDFTDDEFKNIGLYDERRFTDKGRFLVTGNESDLGKFKTPGLRNVGVTAPYMHNGVFKTLEEVVDYYSNPRFQVPHAINMDKDMKKLIGLSMKERADLVAFLKSLTDKAYRNRG